jgi:hypothetical protein
MESAPSPLKCEGGIPEEDVPGEGKATEKEEVEMMKVRFFLNEPPGKT